MCEVFAAFTSADCVRYSVLEGSMTKEVRQ